MFRLLAQHQLIPRHKYLFIELDSNNHVLSRKVLSTREKGMKLMEKELFNLDCEVLDLIYRDKRKHEQEFKCNNGLIFIINRI